MKSSSLSLQYISRSPDWLVTGKPNLSLSITVTFIWSVVSTFAGRNDKRSVNDELLVIVDLSICAY